MTSTVGDLTVTVIGGRNQSVEAHGDGARVLLDDYEIVAEPDSISVNDTSYAAASGYQEIVVEADGWVLSVSADGAPVMEITALEGLTAAAERGAAAAQNDLAVRYAIGDGVEEDAVRAAELYRLAAEQGLPVAQSNYALKLWDGLGVAQDRAAAVDWARRAAEADAGSTAAQYLLGVAYRSGDGVAENLGEARLWLERAAEGGHVRAMNELGVAYARGLGVEADSAAAAEWYRRASEAGNAVGTSNLAFLYWRGNGVEQDLDRAEALFQQAIDGGYADAEDNLAALRAERAEATETAAQPASEDAIYWFAENETPIGPLTLSAMRDAVVAKRIGAQTLVWREGMADWVPAAELDDVAALLAP